MAHDLLIGLDAGTSFIKAVAFDLGGRELGVASRPNRTLAGAGGAVTQDMAWTWSEAVLVLRELAARVPELPRRAVALAVTGQGDGTWLVDAEGRPVGPGWLWLDSRAAGLAEELGRSGVRDAIWRRTGCCVTACNQSTQLLWISRHQPELLARAATAFHCKDYLYLELTGVRATDLAEGIFTFGDWRTRRYAPEVLERLGLGSLQRLLPEPLDGSRVTHGLSAAAAAATGLPAGLPVALGAVDVLCTALGGGAYEPGRDVGLSITGTTGMHMRVFEAPAEPVLPAEPSGYTMPFPVPGCVARLQSNMAATLNIDWVVALAADAVRLAGHGAQPRQLLEALDREVPAQPPGAVLFHPYIHAAGERGPFVDARARAQLTGLAMEVGLAGLMRGVYEGLAFAARDCYAAIGAVPSEVRVAGGATRSAAFRSILASVLGVPLRSSRRAEAGAAGAAMMATVAIGEAPDLGAACRVWVTPCLGALEPPDPAVTSFYDALFESYLATRRAMPPIWAGLAAARGSADIGDPA